MRPRERITVLGWNAGFTRTESTPGPVPRQPGSFVDAPCTRRGPGYGRRASIVSFAARAMSLSSCPASRLSRLERIASTMGAPSGGQTTAMSLRVP